MLKTALFIVLGLGVVVAGVLAYVATQPDTFRIARSTRIAAPPEAIFPLINDLRKFATWSPYDRKDPDMKRIFSGPDEGKGQRYDWDGDGNVGKGWLVIAETSAPSRIVIDLNMVRPMEAKNLVTFTIEPAGAATNVTWAMEGRLSLVARVVHLCFDMERMVGGDFEAGLASLKATVEGAHTTPSQQGQDSADGRS
ncbi:SRPBCC family protein [Hyphomicrobium sp.]|uniref:SRPBCC family protein n=1 Tax=Hyphomicrobium sp. TaxID=82 RepID=UPI0025BD336E|nr:SRPBCC family protein [Hyphomicrobium sp.]MCC7252662.1 SRPBCC family protein [Hyphomicrobium sp.]